MIWWTFFEFTVRIWRTFFRRRLSNVDFRLVNGRGVADAGQQNGDDLTDVLVFLKCKTVRIWRTFCEIRLLGWCARSAEETTFLWILRFFDKKLWKRQKKVASETVFRAVTQCLKNGDDLTDVFWVCGEDLTDVFVVFHVGTILTRMGVIGGMMESMLRWWFDGRLPCAWHQNGDDLTDVLRFQAARPNCRKRRLSFFFDY